MNITSPFSQNVKAEKIQTVGIVGEVHYVPSDVSYIPKSHINCKYREMGPSVYCPLPTTESNHLQMSEQRQHILLSYIKTLSVGPARNQTRVY